MPVGGVLPALLDPPLPGALDGVVLERVGHGATVPAACRPPAGVRPITPSASSSASSSSDSPRPRSTSSLCSPSSGARRRWNRSGPREKRIGSVLWRAIPVTGWSSVLEEAAVLQLRERRLLVRLHDLGDRHAGRPEALDDLVTAPLLAPRRRGARSITSCRARRPAVVASAGSSRPGRLPEGVTEGEPTGRRRPPRSPPRRRARPARRHRRCGRGSAAPRRARGSRPARGGRRRPSARRSARRPR